MHSLEEKAKLGPLTATGNLSLVSTAESRATWPKNARFHLPDAQNVIGLEEATSRDAPRHLKSTPPTKNLLHLGIEMTKLTQELAVKLEQGETFVSGTQWQTEK